MSSETRPPKRSKKQPDWAKTYLQIIDWGGQNLIGNCRMENLKLLGWAIRGGDTTEKHGRSRAALKAAQGRREHLLRHVPKHQECSAPKHGLYSHWLTCFQRKLDGYQHVIHSTKKVTTLRRVVLQQLIGSVPKHKLYCVWVTCFEQNSDGYQHIINSTKVTTSSRVVLCVILKDRWHTIELMEWAPKHRV